eukprot:g20232.t1
MYEYLDYIPSVPQRHRKFVDEAAYSERDLIAKKGCKSRPVDRIVLGDLALREQNDAFYSVIFLASITHPEGGALLSIRQGTNKATHFADAILGAVHARHLLAGDRLILDNAGIHRAKKVIPALRVILSAVGVELVYSISAQILSGVQSSRICIQLDQEQSQAKRYRRIFFGNSNTKPMPTTSPITQSSSLIY